MVEAVNTNSYVKSQMAKLPEIERGEKRTIKRGDCLWNIAKDEVKKKGKATNAAISKYMLEIAKLNELDTPEKRKILKIGSEIYLPKQEKADGKSVTPSVTPAEKSYSGIAKSILNDKTLFIRDANLTLKSTKVYHVFVKEETKKVPWGRKLLCSFSTNAEGKIKDISFENSDKNINPYGYDYDMDSKGNIVAHEYPNESKGKISASEYKAVNNKLQEMISKSGR